MPKLMFEQALEQPPDERFVVGAFDGEALIGISGFVPFGMGEHQGFDSAGELIQMYVKPAYRGRKVGLKLARAVLDEAFKIPGIDQVVLGVVEGNWSAIRVYEQAGFRTIDDAGIYTEGNCAGARTMVIGRDARPDALD